ncbi:hypothetical protein [Streptomyces cupreus]|uniref:Uncharacterized protein n=1 Tax=Streptomyces cupreus TaxID=2759956 RepID=A0A7X1J2W0_9ACTN|nr:hypothetical protein [Streptomyces cupreus]MBC2903134.1 hypothetical protein [Streptomyces cupreus]
MAVAPWRAGNRITAARLDAMQARWSSWTPTWSTTTGSNIPTYGDATIDCSYCQTGDLVVARFEVVFGSTTTFGSTDNWTFSLPVTASATLTDVGEAALQQSNAKRVYARCRLNSTSVFMFEISTGTPDAVALTAGQQGIADASAPWTWASTNSIRATLSYQAA